MTHADAVRLADKLIELGFAVNVFWVPRFRWADVRLTLETAGLDFIRIDAPCHVSLVVSTGTVESPGAVLRSPRDAMRSVRKLMSRYPLTASEGWAALAAREPLGEAGG